MRAAAGGYGAGGGCEHGRTGRGGEMGSDGGRRGYKPCGGHEPARCPRERDERKEWDPTRCCGEHQIRLGSLHRSTLLAAATARSRYRHRRSTPRPPLQEGEGEGSGCLWDPTPPEGRLSRPPYRQVRHVKVVSASYLVSGHHADNEDERERVRAEREGEREG